jgi:hypothetical protein
VTVELTDSILFIAKHQFAMMIAEITESLIFTAADPHNINSVRGRPETCEAFDIKVRWIV